jgi:hypothetical protein
MNMSDLKSMLPDLKELTSMTGKLFHGIKNTVEEIIEDYKQKRAGSENAEQADEQGQEEKPQAAKRKQKSKKLPEEG